MRRPWRSSNGSSSAFGRWWLRSSKRIVSSACEESIAARCRCGAPCAATSLRALSMHFPPLLNLRLSSSCPQILNAVPGSTDQTWHSDNRSRGLSIIIPLVDFTAQNGPTQFLLGSHTQSWPLMVQEGAQVVEAPVGSIAAYDSRTYHRGLGNETSAGRPALIFCFDREASPPPGCGTMGSIANANLAHALNMLSASCIVCASWWKNVVSPS